MADILGPINVPFPEVILLIVILAAFIIISRKIMNTVFNIIWISVASVVFPFVMNFTGFGFPTDIGSIALYVMLGLGAYAAYILGKLIYAMLGIVEKTGKAVTYPVRNLKRGRDERMRKKMEKIVKENEKRKDKDDEEEDE